MENTPFTQNTIRSFRLVKQDMLAVHSQVHRVRFDQAKARVALLNFEQRLRSLEQQLLTLSLTRAKASKPISRKISSPKKTVSNKKFVASKTGNKIHLKNCVFAKNILPKKRLYFASKVKPLNHGFKACECVKK